MESICCNIGYASQIVLCRGCLSSSLYIERGSLSYSNGKSLSMMEKNFPSPHSILSFYTRALSIFCNDGISLLFAIHLYNGRKSHTSIDRGTPARNIITLRISNMKLTELPTQPCLSRLGFRSSGLALIWVILPGKTFTLQGEDPCQRVCPKPSLNSKPLACS